jgi:hypothetical protein
MTALRDGLFYKRNDLVGGWDEKLEDAYVWYDYFSIPQFHDGMSQEERSEIQDLQKEAIASIPAYVQLSSYIFALCPSASHWDRRHDDRPDICDRYSYNQRGWCRFEIIAALLTHISTAVIRISAAHHITVESVETLSLSIGEGEFSCCSFDHKYKGDTIECDKLKLAPIIQRMLSVKEDYYLRKEMYTQFRFTRARRNRVL